MHAVIYARVSDDDRRTGRSVSDQEQESREDADRQGWTVGEVFTDNDRSASRYARKPREQYDRLLTHIGARRVDVLILWESSRGGRELEGWASLLNLCRRRGTMIRVVTHGRTYDLNNARDWRSLADDGVDSAYESEKTRERILRNVRSNAAAGRPHGKLAFGYSREYDERGNFVRQYIKEEEAAIVRESARRIIAGESLYAICADLNERGVPAPRGGKWLLQQIRRLVTNPRYIGQRVFQGAVIGPAQWPAILDEQTYLECKAIVTDPRRRTVKDSALRYLLSGSLKCGVCDGGMRVAKNRGYLTYVCQVKFCTAVRTVKVEEYITELVLDRLSRPDVRAVLAAPQPQDVNNPAEDEAAKLRERLDAFYEASAAGEISPAGLAKIEARLLREIAEVEEHTTSGRIPAILRDMAGPDIRKRWEGMPVALQRGVIDLLMTIRVQTTVRGTRFTPARVEIEWKTF